MARNGRPGNRSAQIPLNFSLKVGTRLDADAKVWVSHAPALNLYSQGTTESRAIEALTCAVHSLLSAAYKHGILEEVLQEAGLVPAHAARPANGTNDTVSQNELFKGRAFTRISDVTAGLELVTA